MVRYQLFTCLLVVLAVLLIDPAVLAQEAKKLCSLRINARNLLSQKLRRKTEVVNDGKVIQQRQASSAKRSGDKPPGES